MRVTVHDSFESFRQQAGPLYEADPGRHSIPLTTMAASTSYEAGPKPVLVTVHGSEGVAGAYLRTPPFPAQVGALPAALAPLVVDVLREVDSDVDAVFGPEPEARAFAEAWATEGIAQIDVEMRQRRYELDDLVPPHGVPGQLRPFESADVSWLARWRAACAEEAGDSGAGASEAALRSFIAGGRVPVLWAVGDEPRSMAFVSRPLGGMSRIGQVYTPGEHRGHGYGSAVTAAAAVEAREMAADLVMLYADLANPVSNSIYRRLGFRPVEDVVVLKLHGR